jgi:mannitol/fructose-specific phosphotransferase system IIA component (Ntr-type)
MPAPASFSGMFTVEGILPDLAAQSKSEALIELVGLAVTNGVLPKARKAEVIAALEAREERGSTGLGRGIAIPHAKIPGLRKHAGLIGRSVAGLDFRSIDGEPVHVMVMLISPESRADEHLELLRFISRIARDHDFTSFIRQAHSPQEILEVIQERGA